MDGTIPDKRFFRIGEVSKILGVEPYVVRYWESEFKQAVKPLRSDSDQRVYRRKDVEQLLVIRDLLYNKRFTIAGAKKKLVELSGGKEKKEKVDMDDDAHRMLMEIKKQLQELLKTLG